MVSDVVIGIWQRAAFDGYLLLRANLSQKWLP